MSPLPIGSTVSVPRLRCRSIVAVALAVGSTLGARSALGTDLSPRAELLFSEGLDLARSGECAQAREKFAASYAADPAPGTLINWGLCEEKLGRIATALALLRLADEHLPAGHPKISEVKNEVAALRKRVPYLRIHPLRLLPAGTMVLKDTAQVEPSSMDQPQPSDPGVHVIEVHAPGHEIRRYEVVLNEGRTVDLDFEFGAPKEPTPTASGVLADGGEAERPFFGWVVGGVGIAAVGVGAVTGWLALSRLNDVQRYCDVVAKTCPTDQGYDAATSGHALATVSTVSFVAGGVGLLAGAYLLLNVRRPAAPSATRSSLAITPNGRGIQISGAF